MGVLLKFFVQLPGPLECFHGEDFDVDVEVAGRVDLMEVVFDELGAGGLALGEGGVGI